MDKDSLVISELRTEGNRPKRSFQTEELVSRDIVSPIRLSGGMNKSIPGWNQPV